MSELGRVREALMKIERLQPLADALAERVAAVDEEGHVRAESQRERHELFSAAPRSPDLVQHQENGRGVRGAAAEACAHGQVLLEPEFGAQGRARLVSEEPRRTHAEILLVEDPGKPDLAVGPGGDADPVGAVDEAKRRLQLVIARVLPFVAAPQDVQEKVELPRRRVPGHFHWVTAKRSSMPG